MPELLTTQWRPPTFDWISQQVLAAGQAQRQREELQQNMALRLAALADDQQKQAATSDFQRQQEDRLNRQLDIQQSHNAAADAREADRAATARVAAEGKAAQTAHDAAPFKYSGATYSDAPTGLRITDYGQPDDPDLDSNTAKGLSAIGKLGGSSMAVSPDVEKMLSAKGVKIGDPVTVRLSDGTEITRRWDDRTSRKLTGRVDLYSPDGASPMRGAAVSDILPFRGDALAGFSPLGPAAALASVASAVPEAKVAAAKAPPMQIAPPELSAGQRLSNLAAELSQLPVSNKDAAGILKAAVTPVLKSATGQGVKMQFKTASDGTPYAFNPATGETHQLAVEEGVKFGHLSASAEDLTKDMAFVPEHNTYRKEDGSEWFVNGGKLLSFRPTAVKAKRWAQGDDGNVYPLGDNGEPLKPIPDGVHVSLTGGKIQTVKDNAGNVHRVNDDGTITMMIPATAKVTAKDRKEYMDALEAAQDAEVELRGKRESKGLFGSSAQDIKDAEASLQTAQEKVRTYEKMLPGLNPQAPPAPPKAPAAGTVYKSEAEARAAGAKPGEVVMMINPATGKPARAQIN